MVEYWSRTSGDIRKLNPPVFDLAQNKGWGFNSSPDHPNGVKSQMVPKQGGLTQKGGGLTYGYPLIINNQW